jgi:hypothetical protein
VTRITEIAASSFPAHAPRRGAVLHPEHEMKAQAEAERLRGILALARPETAGAEEKLRRSASIAVR